MEASIFELEVSTDDIAYSSVALPAAGTRIPLDTGGVAGFRATITDWAGEIVVKIDGGFGSTEGAARSITMDFSRQEKTTSAFDYAIASKGQVLVKKGAVTSTTGVDPAIVALMSSSPTAGAFTVQIGSNQIILNGSALPRRTLTYK